jgi:DNA-nicking Smr family endonuclease
MLNTFGINKIKPKKMKTLDLHGVKHADVPKLMDQFIWEQMNKKSREVEIITGISQAMKQVVIKNLKDYDFIYNEAWNNPGKFIVTLV